MAKVYSTQEIASFDFTIDYAYYLPAGHGHKEIRVSVKFDLENGNKEHREFRCVTDNMQAIDNAYEIDNMQEYYEALFNIVEHKINVIITINNEPQLKVVKRA